MVFFFPPFPNGSSELSDFIRLNEENGQMAMLTREGRDVTGAPWCQFLEIAVYVTLDQWRGSVPLASSRLINTKDVVAKVLRETCWPNKK